MFYGHVMCVHLEQPKKKEIFTLLWHGLSLSRQSNTEKLTRLKIASDILMPFAGKLFTKEIEDTESL